MDGLVLRFSKTGKGRLPNSSTGRGLARVGGDDRLRRLTIALVSEVAGDLEAEPLIFGVKQAHPARQVQADKFKKVSSLALTSAGAGPASASFMHGAILD